MDISHLDIEISLKSCEGEKDGQNINGTLFSRKFRIDTSFGIALDDAHLQGFVHQCVDKMLRELQHFAEGDALDTKLKL